MVCYLKKLGLRFLRDESAATAVEYGLLIGFISVAIVITVFAIGEDIEGFFTVIHEYISSTQ